MIVHRTTKTGRRARKHPCTIHHWYRLSHGDERRKISHTHTERERERKREFMNRKHTRVRLCHFTHSFILFLFYSISDKINHASALTLTYRLRKIRASKLSNAIDRDVCTYTMSLVSHYSLSLSLEEPHHNEMAAAKSPSSLSSRARRSHPPAFHRIAQSTLLRLPRPAHARRSSPASSPLLDDNNSNDDDGPHDAIPLTSRQAARLRRALESGRRHFNVRDVVKETGLERRVILQWYDEYIRRRFCTGVF